MIAEHVETERAVVRNTFIEPTATIGAQQSPSNFEMIQVNAR